MKRVVEKYPVKSFRVYIPMWKTKNCREFIAARAPDYERHYRQDDRTVDS
jgi:hypothetical protein